MPATEFRTIAEGREAILATDLNSFESVITTAVGFPVGVLREVVADSQSDLLAVTKEVVAELEAEGFPNLADRLDKAVTEASMAAYAYVQKTK